MRYKLTIEYVGTDYCGFQKQPDQPNGSIEEVLENAIFNFCNQRVKLFASGRTDAGVHALGQVLHFDLDKAYDAYETAGAINHHLQRKNIAIVHCETVDDNFHSRYDAKSRAYRYVIINRRAHLTLQTKRAWHVTNALNIANMQQASHYLIGVHDFSSFRDGKCCASTPIRRVNHLEIKKVGEEIHIEISAKSFLHHMVRNIVGTLVWVGTGKAKPEDMQTILKAKSRIQSGPNAPAHGLYFLKVDY